MPRPWSPRARYFREIFLRLLHSGGACLPLLAARSAPSFAARSGKKGEHSASIQRALGERHRKIRARRTLARSARPSKLRFPHMYGEYHVVVALPIQHPKEGYKTFDKYLLWCYTGSGKPYRQWKRQNQSSGITKRVFLVCLGTSCPLQEGVGSVSSVQLNSFSGSTDFGP